jgi:hypothetical protein
MARPPQGGQAPGMGLGKQIRIALRDRNYLCLHAGFFTCGFHIAFLVTHLPGEVALCNLSAGVSGTALGLIGLFNIAGSLAAGALSTRYRMKSLLAVMYASRAVIVAAHSASAEDAADVLCPPPRSASPGWRRCRRRPGWWASCSACATCRPCSA